MSNSASIFIKKNLRAYAQKMNARIDFKMLLMIVWVVELWDRSSLQFPNFSALHMNYSCTEKGERSAPQ